MKKTKKENVTIEAASEAVMENENIIPFEVGSNQAFKRHELERLECLSKEEIDLILEYQKKLPVLTGDNDSWINARDLWEQLGVTLDFSSWIKNQFKSLELKENIDYFLLLFKKEQTDVPKNKLHGGINRKDYMITVSSAKDIAMVSGSATRVSDKLKYNSKLTRSYFKLMEKAVRENQKWQLIRDPEKQAYKEMCEALDNYCFRTLGRGADKWDYAREADMINLLVTGQRAKHWRVIFGISTMEMIRDRFKKNYNEQILFVERQNIIKLRLGKDFNTRWDEITAEFHAMYPNHVCELVM